MRDLIITLIVFSGIPFIFVEPIVGLLMWGWLSYMTPYRLAWGFAHNFPFVLLTALATLMSLVVVRNRVQRFRWTPTTVVWALFLAWLSVTTVFALYPHDAFVKWEEVMKIQLMVLVTFLLVHKRQHLDWVIWVAVLSLGFYGVKGGIFTILTGGHYHVWGPPGSWIGDNNELGAAVLLVMPLMRYLQLQVQRRWIWWGLAGMLILSGFTVLGTYSRGDFIGAVVMVGLLWWRSRRRLLLAVPIFAVAAVAVAFMPQQWVERMHSTQHYQQNASALGRINAWHMATNLASHRLTGGGFEAFTPQMFQKYAPEPQNVHAAHSIFFQILGDSGFIGLGLYLLLGFLTIRNCGWVRRQTRKRDELRWAQDLSSMLQVSFAGFAASAAFLSLSYYDLPYQLMACTVILRLLVARELAEGHASVSADSKGNSLRAGDPAGPRPEWAPGSGDIRKGATAGWGAGGETPPARARGGSEKAGHASWRPGVADGRQED